MSRIAGNQRFSIIPAVAVQDGELSDAAFRTLAALGVYGDKNGWCFPSYSTLARIRGVSRSSIYRHIAELVERGYLNIQPRYDQRTGAQKTNMIQIRFDYAQDNTTDLPDEDQESEIDEDDDNMNTSTSDCPPGETLPCSHNEYPSCSNSDTPLTPHINVNNARSNERACKRAPTPPADVSKPRKRKESHPLRSHPAVAAYRKIMHLQIPDAWLEETVKIVGDGHGLVWEKFLRDWLGAGYNPRNIRGILDAFNKSPQLVPKHSQSQPRRTRADEIREHNRAVIQEYLQELSKEEVVNVF